VLPTIVFSGSDLNLVEFPFIRRLKFYTAARRGTVFSCPSCEIVNVPDCGLVFAEETNPGRVHG
jgi:hypothetical protein